MRGQFVTNKSIERVASQKCLLGMDIASASILNTTGAFKLPYITNTWWVRRHFICLFIFHRISTLVSRVVVDRPSRQTGPTGQTWTVILSWWQTQAYFLVTEGLSSCDRRRHVLLWQRKYYHWWLRLNKILFINKLSLHCKQNGKVMCLMKSSWTRGFGLSSHRRSMLHKTNVNACSWQCRNQQQTLRNKNNTQSKLLNT